MSASDNAEDRTSERASEFTFQCIIPQPIPPNQYQTTGTFPHNDPVTRLAKCVLKDGRFSLSRTRELDPNPLSDSYEWSKLLSVPITSISQVTFFNVTHREKKRYGEYIKRYAGYGASGGLILVGLCLMMARRRQLPALDPFSWSSFLLFALMMLGVCMAMTIAAGVIMAADKAARRKMVEFQLVSEEQGLIAAFRVSPDRSEDIVNAMRSVGWTPTPPPTGAGRGIAESAFTATLRRLEGGWRGDRRDSLSGRADRMCRACVLMTGRHLAKRRCRAFGPSDPREEDLGQPPPVRALRALRWWASGQLVADDRGEVRRGDRRRRAYVPGRPGGGRPRSSFGQARPA